MTFKPATVANYFLDKARRAGAALTPMQVIKLVYISHGWHLGYFDQALIDEPVEAWQYGPVIGSLYQDLKKYRNLPVNGTLPMPFDEAVRISSSGNTKALLDHVWDRYSRFNGLQLSTLTHQAGTPWHQVWEEGSGKYSRCDVIPNEVIKGHYKGMIAGSGQG